MQIAPQKELLPYIKHYLFLDSEENCVKKFRLFSDGNTGMVFTFSGNLIASRQDFKAIKYPASFIYGQITEFKDLYFLEKTSIIIAVFQPYGLNRLLGINGTEAKDAVIAIEDIFGGQGQILHEKLLNELSFEAKLQVLNSFFLERSTKKAISNQTLIQTSLTYILKSKGNISINQLVKHTGYTERHIERIFKESIGLSPKKFGNIVKLHSFLNLLKDKSKHSNFTNFCYEAGYADQSHLIKEFKKYTGITPTQYLNNTNRLAINFMEIRSNEQPMSGLYNLQKIV